MSTTKTINLSDQQIQVAVALIDLAVKAHGLRVAKEAAELMAIFEAALQTKELSNDAG